MNEPLGHARSAWYRAARIALAAIAGGCLGFFGGTVLAQQGVPDDGLILVRGFAILQYGLLGMGIGALAAAGGMWWWSRRRRSPG